jgi:hypothetical protein
MSALDKSSLPYPGMDLAAEQAKRLAKLTDADTAMVPWFGQPAVDVPSSAATALTGPRRVRGATLARKPPPSFTPYAPELYERVARGIRHLTDAIAVPLADKPAAPAGYPEGVVRGLLIAGLWDAARWYEDLDAESCPDCGADEGLCSWHAPRYVKTLEYQGLHDLVINEPSDAAALAAVADSCRARTAEPGDLGSPGSPLAVILADVLAVEGVR